MGSQFEFSSPFQKQLKLFCCILKVEFCTREEMFEMKTAENVAVSWSLSRTIVQLKESIHQALIARKWLYII